MKPDIEQMINALKQYGEICFSASKNETHVFLLAEDSDVSSHVYGKDIKETIFKLYKKIVEPEAEGDK